MNFYNNTDALVHFGIRGMKWGVRRFENADGTLTEAGKKRYNAEKEKNDSKRQKNRMSEAEVKNVNRWVKEDRTNTKQVIDSGAQLSRNAMELERSIPKKEKRMDLSKMSDKEMREHINREFLERQYNDLFNPKKVNRGRERVKDILAITGASLGVGSSALAIALNIQALRGKG